MPGVRIAENVFQVGGSALTRPEDAAIYLLRFGDEAALIDAGCGQGTSRLLSNIEDVGVSPSSVTTLLLTHCHFDHTGGAKAIRDALGCRVVAHALDAPFIESADSEVTAAEWYGARMVPCPVDVRLMGEEETIVVGDGVVTAIAIPGHSPGSVAFLVENGGKKVLFAQDVHGPLHPSLRSNRTDYLASLKRLLTVDADVLCEGHYGIFHGRARIAEFIHRFLR